MAWYNTANPDDYPYTNPQPVALKKANELDLYDMSGNVSEWCQDWFGSYNSNEQTDPTGPDSGEYRVIRGGEISFFYRDCRVSWRWGIEPSINYSTHCGLRLAM
ncbi:MAG: SUMF1/EgtB/PvdO family nonheme iron enzyme [Muribaculaceae bacterium]|nr:SUMF1/EgtB/PvdO family nonheme iron enzyme [Muribaculaceae bacterium]